jgi:hypothetical protein
MQPARLRIPVTDVIGSLGRLQIAFELLVADGVAAKADVIALQQLFIVEEIHLPVRLVDLNLGYGRAVVGLEFRAAAGRKAKRERYKKEDPQKGHDCNCPIIFCNL